MIFADRYKMASIQCEGRQIEITADHALDVDELIYISGVTVTIGTTSKDGTVIYQTNKLTLRNLTSVRTALTHTHTQSSTLQRRLDIKKINSEQVLYTQTRYLVSVLVF